MTQGVPVVRLGLESVLRECCKENMCSLLKHEEQLDKYFRQRNSYLQKQRIHSLLGIENSIIWPKQRVVEYICGREDGEVTGKGGWKRGRWDQAEITKGPVHYIREHGLYPESTWKEATEGFQSIE